MKRIIKVLALFILINANAIHVNGTTNPDIRKGWDHFAKNEYKEAGDHFRKALTGKDQADAHLALSILAQVLENEKMQSEHELQFIKTSNNPEPYIEALWSIWTGKRTSTELNILEELLKTNNGYLHALAHQTLGHHYRAINRMTASANSFNNTGSVNKWQVVGEFENISESGFDKDHEPLHHPEKTIRSQTNMVQRFFGLTSRHHYTTIGLILNTSL